MNLFGEDTKLAVEAALGAGELLRQAFGTVTAVDYKSEDQPVTDADRAADAYLRSFLSKTRPEYGWVSEESTPHDAAAASVWVVDPLDGTVNFIEGRPEFAVCIGLVRGGDAITGVVYNPVSGDLYIGERGVRPVRNGQEIAAAEWRNPPRLVVSWAEVDQFRSTELGLCEVSTVGSTALKIMRVAEGAADAYISSGPKRIWDLCAPMVIAEAAGATVLDGHGRRITFSENRPEVQGTIAVGTGGESHVPRLARVSGI